VVFGMFVGLLSCNNCKAYMEKNRSDELIKGGGWHFLQWVRLQLKPSMLTEFCDTVAALVGCKVNNRISAGPRGEYRRVFSNKNHDGRRH
jgi:hypothetical protein